MTWSLQKGQMQGKAQLYPDALSSLREWVWDTITLQQSHPSGRSVHFWVNERRQERPKVQLVCPGEPCFAASPVRGGEDSAWDQLAAEPATDAQAEFFAHLDNFAVDLASRQCMEWFGKSLSVDQITGMYRPLLRKPGSAINLHVRRSGCRVWNVYPNDVYDTGSFASLATGSRVLPCVTINGIYFKAREMGLSLTCTDLLVYSRDALPFQLERPLIFRANVQTEELPEHAEMHATRSDRTEAAEHFGARTGGD